MHEQHGRELQADSGVRQSIRKGMHIRDKCSHEALLLLLSLRGLRFLRAPTRESLPEKEFPTPPA